MKTLQTNGSSPNNLPVKTLAMCILSFIPWSCYSQRWCCVPFSPRKRVLLAWDTARVQEVQLGKSPPGIHQATGLA